MAYFNKLDELCKVKGVTKQEVSDSTGLSYNSICFYCLGRSKVSVQAAMKLAHFFYPEVDVDSSKFESIAFDLKQSIDNSFVGRYDSYIKNVEKEKKHREDIRKNKYKKLDKFDSSADLLERLYGKIDAEDYKILQELISLNS